jgi:hypothetical protein
LGEYTDATVEIRDNEPTPVPGAVRFSGSEYTINAEEQTAQITIQRLFGFVGDISVAWRTVESSAKQGTHYKSASGVVHFADGESSKTISIDIINDPEITNPASFMVELYEPIGTVIEGSNTATVSITPISKKPESSGGSSGGSFSLWMLALLTIFIWLFSPNVKSIIFGKGK